MMGTSIDYYSAIKPTARGWLMVPTPLEVAFGEGRLMEYRTPWAPNNMRFDTETLRLSNPWCEVMLGRT